MKTLLKITIITIMLSACVTPKTEKGISYTQIFRENKGMRQTFILTKKELIWVMNYNNHCLPMQADISIAFTQEVPYKRFKNTIYNVTEFRGYTCDSEYAILAPLDGQLVYYLRTHYIKTVSVRTASGRLIVPVKGKAIMDAIAKLDWKTPIPSPATESDTRTPESI